MDPTINILLIKSLNQCFQIGKLIANPEILNFDSQPKI